MSLAGPVPELGAVDLALRILGAALLGGLVGIERELTGRPAGFRTHILVSLGAALFTMAGAYGVAPFFADGGADVSFDPTRVAAQVVTGIGFLGAGAIIRTGANVQGLTTAAALWVTAAIGLAAGLGYWSGAVATTAVTIFALYALRSLERGAFRRLRKGQHHFVVDARSGVTLSSLMEVIESRKGRLQAVHLETEPAGDLRLDLVVRLAGGVEPEEVADALGAVEGVGQVDWSR